MHHRGCAPAAAQLDEGRQVIQVTVNAAVGHQPHQVDGPPALCGPGGRRAQGPVLEKAAVRDGIVDEHQVLPDNAAGAEGHVAHLRVPHLPVRKPDGAARCLQQSMVVTRQIVVEARRVGDRDRVVRLARVDPDTIKDN
jgi:hypothetical protein